MSSLLSSPKGRIGAIVAGSLLLIAACWLLLVAPQRSKAAKLDDQVAAARAQLLVRRAGAANPSAAVDVRPSDLFKLTKALPNEAGMPGIILDVNRLAGRNELAFRSVTPTTEVLGNGYRKQPLTVVVQGRFGDFSRFLGDLRTLVTVRGGRLDTRGRLYSVSKIDLSAPDGAAAFPVVKATVVLNAFTYSAPVPTPPANPDSSTTTDQPSDGTVAAGANP